MDNTTMTQEISVEALKAKHERIYEVSFEIQPEGEKEIARKYYFTKPKTASYDRYVKTMSQSVTKATKVFVLDNVVPEQADQLAADLEEYPAMALGLGEKLLTMLGLAKDVNLARL